MNCDVRQPIQDAFTPMTNVGKQYKLTLKPERGKTNTHYVNLFNGSHIDDFIYQFVILPFDLKASEVSANIESSLDRKGKGIGIPDTLIAGICISNNLPLLTLNTLHFSRVTGLNLIPID